MVLTYFKIINQELLSMINLFFQWLASTTPSGDIYFYAGDGSQRSQWTLPPVSLKFKVYFY